MLALVDHFCRDSRIRIKDYFRGIRRNNDRAGYKLAQGVLGGAGAWMFEEVVGEGPLAVAHKHGSPDDRHLVAS